MKLKKALALVLIFTMAIPFVAVPALAETTPSFIVHDTPEAIYYRANGEIAGYGTIRPLKFDYDEKNVPEKVFVPLREVAEMLGCSVTWIQSTKTILLQKEGYLAVITLEDDLCYYVKGKKAPGTSSLTHLILQDGVVYFEYRDYMDIFGYTSQFCSYQTDDTDLSHLAGETYMGDEVTEELIRKTMGGAAEGIIERMRQRNAEKAEKEKNAELEGSTESAD